MGITGDDIPVLFLENISNMYRSREKSMMEPLVPTFCLDSDLSVNPIFCIFPPTPTMLTQVPESCDLALDMMS